MANMNIGILIGAGASFGASGIAPEKPPLGGELLDRLQAAFPATWGALLDDEELAAFKEDPPFESGMRLLWYKNDQRMQSLLTDMAIYFSRFVPDGSHNLYRDLLRMVMSVRGSSFAFCSLNYECVFEQIAAEVGLNLANLSMVTEPPCALLLKPHGSCNYIHPVTRNISNLTTTGSPHYVYHEAPGFGDLEVVPCNEVAKIYEKVAPSIPPAMSLFEPSKHSPVDPGLMGMVRRGWVECAMQGDVILTIGARPVLADHHIWDAVISSSAVVWFVGGQDDAYSDLEARIGKRLTHIGSTFAEALPVIDDQLKNLGR